MMPSLPFVPIQNEYCSTGGPKTTTINATQYVNIEFPAPRFVAPADYFTSQSATGVYSCERCGTFIAKEALFHDQVMAGAVYGNGVGGVSSARTALFPLLHHDPSQGPVILLLTYLLSVHDHSGSPPDPSG